MKLKELVDKIKLFSFDSEELKHFVFRLLTHCPIETRVANEKIVLYLILNPIFGLNCVDSAFHNYIYFSDSDYDIYADNLINSNKS